MKARYFVTVSHELKCENSLERVFRKICAAGIVHREGTLKEIENALATIAKEANTAFPRCTPIIPSATYVGIDGTTLHIGFGGKYGYRLTLYKHLGNVKATEE